MPTELDLIKYEKLASIILIISNFIIYFSAVKSEQLIVQEQRTENLPGPTPAQLVAAASLAKTIGYFLLAVLATIRLQQRQDEIRRGESAVPIEPNLKITAASWETMFSSFLSAIGTAERAKEPQAPITIL